MTTDLTNLTTEELVKLVIKRISENHIATIQAAKQAAKDKATIRQLAVCARLGNAWQMEHKKIRKLQKILSQVKDKEEFRLYKEQLEVRLLEARKSLIEKEIANLRSYCKDLYLFKDGLTTPLKEELNHRAGI